MKTVGLEFGREIVNLKRSEIRKLLGLAASPGVLSCAAGLPSGEQIPVEEFRDCVNTVLQRDGSRALQYGPQYEPLKEWLVEFMRRRNVDCEFEQVLITNGAQQGLAIVSRLFLDPEDVAVTEEITFTGIQQVTAGRGVEVRTIPTHPVYGADMEALETALQKEPRPKLVILIPDFHNPLGVSIPKENRALAADLAATYEVPMIEDDPYSQLRFDGKPLDPIVAYDREELIFYLGSFSKMLAPAMRLGWIVTPVDLMPKIRAMRESLDLETSALMQRAVSEFVNRGLLEPHLKAMNAAHGLRCDAMQSSLEEHMSDVATWTCPEGGLFIWVTLHEGIDTREIFNQAIERKVAYVPGEAFAVHGDHTNTMRLSYCNLTVEQIHEAVRRLGEIVHNLR
jgi:DNA-binding transcriptional MocR family regulator